MKKTPGLMVLLFWLEVLGFEYWAQGLGFGDVGYGASGLNLRSTVLGLRVWGLRFVVLGLK